MASAPADSSLGPLWCWWVASLLTRWGVMWLEGRGPWGRWQAWLAAWDPWLSKGRNVTAESQLPASRAGALRANSSSTRSVPPERQRAAEIQRFQRTCPGSLRRPALQLATSSSMTSSTSRGAPHVQSRKGREKNESLDIPSKYPPATCQELALLGT